MSAFRFFIGTHASAEEASILKCEVDFAKGSFRTLYTMQKISDPTYLALSASSTGDRILYALGKASGNSAGAGAVYALREETDVPALSVLNTLASDGAGPCHISVDARGDFLLCANYGSGSVALYDLNLDGSLRSLCDFRQYSGTGFDSTDRQKGPHAHFAGFHGERDEVLVCDLGLDMVYVYELDRQAHKLRETGRSIRLPDGSGPRHLAFSDRHPGLLYVLTEMANTIFVYQYEESESPSGQAEGQYRCVQTISAAPAASSQDGARLEDQAFIAAPAATAEENIPITDGIATAPVESAPPDEALMVPATADNGSIGCAIRFSGDGRYLFVSSRLGYQSISAFRCDDSGRLHFVSRCLCGGITPRDFNLFEENIFEKNLSGNNLAEEKDSAAGGEEAQYCYLLTANQDSGLVTALRFDRQTETLELMEMSMQASKPTCILPNDMHFA